MTHLLPLLTNLAILLVVAGVVGFVLIRLVLPAIVRVIRREWTRGYDFRHH